ncbi:hypothetical protein LXA43DRAFT_1100837 [Ganoderma leucocontextum]|nr:hypothetical protein LXA43DRAFT_1100837 [Ganoderma leucocontextum]
MSPLFEYSSVVDCKCFRPREDWSTNGAALVEKFNAAFAHQTEPREVLVKFATAESAKITQALKALGLTFSEFIAITDSLPPTVNRRKNIVSCLVYTPYRINYAPLSTLTGKAGLLAAMRQAKGQYDAWLPNPCLPHLIDPSI